MRIGVTGAAGFLGRHVVRALAEAGHVVQAHLGPPGTPGAGACFEMDDTERVDTWVRGLDGVVHLAGPPWIGASFADPVGTLRPHTIGTAALCMARPPWLIDISSAAVYAPAEHALTEDAPCAPRSPYAIAKKAAEDLIRALNLPAVILRPFNVYGPGGHARSVLGQILRQRSTGRVEIYDGAPIRDFVHVTDVARGVVAAIEHTQPGAPIINLGSGDARSIRALAKHVNALVQRPFELIETATGAVRPVRVAADISKAERLLSWRPEIDLQTGLRALIDHHSRDEEMRCES